MFRPRYVRCFPVESFATIGCDLHVTYPLSGELFASIFDERLDGMLVFQLLHAAFLCVHLLYSVVLRELGQHLSSGKTSSCYKSAKARKREGQRNRGRSKRLCENDVADWMGGKCLESGTNSRGRSKRLCENDVADWMGGKCLEIGTNS